MPEAAPAAANHRYGLVSGGASAKLYSDIETSDAPRLSSGLEEFDRVLGGGIVPGALVLLGGEPGNPLPLEVHEGIGEHDDRLRACSSEGREGGIELADGSDPRMHDGETHALGRRLEL